MCALFNAEFQENRNNVQMKDCYRNIIQALTHPSPKRKLALVNADSFFQDKNVQTNVEKILE